MVQTTLDETEWPNSDTDIQLCDEDAEMKSDVIVINTIAENVCNATSAFIHFYSKCHKLTRVMARILMFRELLLHLLYVGVDYIGPIMMKSGHSNVKRYGVMFTCFTTRAFHLQIAHSLYTESCNSTLYK